MTWVRTKDHKLKASRRREEIGKNLVHIVDDIHAVPMKVADVNTYLALLCTMLLAYAIAGVKLVAGAVLPTTGFNRGDDLNDFFTSRSTR